MRVTMAMQAASGRATAGQGTVLVAPIRPNPRPFPHHARSRHSRRETNAAPRPAGHQPVQRYAGVITGRSSGLRARADRHPDFTHAPDRRRILGCGGTVAPDEVLALVRHPLLDPAASAQGFDALDVARRDRFRVVDDPVQAIEPELAAHSLEYVAGPADRFVVGCVQP